MLYWEKEAITTVKEDMVSGFRGGKQGRNATKAMVYI